MASTIIRLTKQCLRRHRFDQFLGGDDALHRQKAPLGGHQEEIVEVGVDAGVGRIAVAVTEIQVGEGGIQAQCRHGDQCLVPAARRRIRRRDRLQLACPELWYRAAQPGANRQERQPLCRGLQTAAQHALVHLPGLDRAAGAGVREPRVVERRRVQRDEPVVDPLDLARRAQQPQVRPAVGDHRQIGDIRAQDGPHERHGLAPRAPAGDADGHAAAQLRDGVVKSGSFIGHYDFFTKASRCSSATPARLSSKVKPCSIR